ncbi:MAG: flagellar filament capping protein FliD [Synergistaceae bacterium]|jgi:flagellar capping protein FliD|nr:flagellar filament capping protein FliD [Synergistaceae bacterium]
MAMSITGIVSGIDWDSMVSELLEKVKQPAYVILDKRDRLERTKTLWEELQVSMQALQSALSPLKLVSTFKAKEVEIERLDRNTSYKGVLTATVNADAAINIHELEVVQLAKAQVNRSNQFSSVTSQFGNILGSSSSYFYINAGGHKVRIDVASTDTLTSLTDKINTQLKTQSSPVGVTASVVDNKLVLKSDNTGLGDTTHTATITRSVNSYDTVFFSTSSDNTDSTYDPPTYTLDMELGGGFGEGRITIMGADGTTYTSGVDFDVVGGDSVRWRILDPVVPPPGALYYDTYTAYAGDTFSMTATRSSDGNVDSLVLPFTPKSGGEVNVEFGGNTYSSTDANPVFQVTSDGSIHWLDTNKPVDGESYKVTYIAAGDESVTLEITRNNKDELSVNYADIVGGTTTIQQSGSRVWREGIDFDIVQDINGKAVVQWYTGGAGDAPEPNSSYDITLYKIDGTTDTISVTRNAEDTFSLPHNGTFETDPHGMHKITYNGLTFDYSTSSVIDAWSYDAKLDSSNQNLVITWAAPNPASMNPPSPGMHSKTPAYGSTYTVEYTYGANTFFLSDDGNGTLAAFGLDNMDADHYTAAQDALLVLNGETVSRSSNFIGEGYGNELITGMTLQLKGVGQVSLDVSQDAESAVTALQNCVTAYNDILDWINVRMTEKALDDTAKATVDSDDFRMNWGLLKGNSLLRTTKNSMRLLTSQVYAALFTERVSRNAIFGTMLQNGVLRAENFTISAGDRTLSVTVDPSDTLSMVAAKINNPQLDGQNNPLFYDANGEAYSIPLAKAEVENNKLVIRGDGQVSLGGSTSMLSSLGLNYEYSTLSQIGIKLASTGTVSDEGKSGELNFDTSTFMAALENNADDVSALVTSFATQMQTFVDNMIKSSQKEVASGFTTAQGSVVREMNAIDTEIASIDEYLEKFEARLQAKQASLQAQFAAAEVSLSTLVQQASWLETVTAQLQSSS